MISFPLGATGWPLIAAFPIENNFIYIHYCFSGQIFALHSDLPKSETFTLQKKAKNISFNKGLRHRFNRIVYYFPFFQIFKKKNKKQGLC